MVRYLTNTVTKSIYNVVMPVFLQKILHCLIKKLLFNTQGITTIYLMLTLTQYSMGL